VGSRWTHGLSFVSGVFDGLMDAGKRAGVRRDRGGSITIDGVHKKACVLNFLLVKWF